MRISFSYFAIPIIAICGLSNAFAVDNSAQVRNRADEFASKGMEFTLKECSIPTTCGGMPFIKQRKEKRETGNDLVVEERTLEFEGLIVELGFALEYPPGKAIKDPYKHPSILGLTITQPRWPVVHGLRVGVDRALVIQTLGEGTIQGECIEYVSVKKQDSVLICLKNNRVNSIKWVPWSDA